MRTSTPKAGLRNVSPASSAPWSRRSSRPRPSIAPAGGPSKTAKIAPGLTLLRRWSVRWVTSSVTSSLQVYLTPWPQGVLHVDVVGYAGAQGGYTSLLPLHIVISSHDPRNQGMAAFEVLFLEASTALAQGLNEAISAQCRRLDIPIPRDLWQAMLFYTTGELTRRFVEANPAVSGGVAYVPYAYRNGLFAHGWSNYQPLLERYWQPYLDGQIGFDAAISRILTGLV